MDDLFDGLNMYTSKPKGHGKVVQPALNNSEESHQLRFCKWIKHEYPHVLFRSDIQSSSNKSYYAQNLKQILDPYSGWPDITVYDFNLMIELKKPGASISNEHYRNQAAMQERLRALGWNVHTCFGVDEAVKIFLEYSEK